MKGRTTISQGPHEAQASLWAVARRAFALDRRRCRRILLAYGPHPHRSFRSGDPRRYGHLLRAVSLSLSFDVFVTVDQRLRYQQNVVQFAVGIVVIETFDTTLPNLRTMLSQLRAAINDTAQGTITIVKPA